MTRVVQPKGTRGSLKWIQIAVNERPSVLDAAIGVAGKIEWLSPVAADDFAEYRDADFLKLVGCENLAPKLAEFWPKRGPQWDALARTDRGEVLIVEAKAHIPELFSPPSGAGMESRAKIEEALRRTHALLEVKSPASWGTHYYQYCNRLAHLMFLREQGVNARLVFLNFIRDADMNGPETAAEWEAAYEAAALTLDIPREHTLSQHVSHAYVDVNLLAG